MSLNSLSGYSPYPEPKPVCNAVPEKEGGSAPRTDPLAAPSPQAPVTGPLSSVASGVTPLSVDRRSALSREFRLGLLRSRLEDIAGDYDIRASRANGSPIDHSSEVLADALISDAVQRIVIAGAFAEVRGPRGARDEVQEAITQLARTTAEAGKQVFYLTTPNALDRIAIQTLVSVGFARGKQHSTPRRNESSNAASRGIEMLARLCGDSSPPHLLVVIQDKQR